jgi:hypothetical protein
MWVTFSEDVMLMVGVLVSEEDWERDCRRPATGLRARLEEMESRRRFSRYASVS